MDGTSGGSPESTAGGAPGIVDLLRAVSEVEGLDRIRLLYLYPKEIRDSLIEEMATNPVVASYFDLSLQHASKPCCGRCAVPATVIAIAT
jgi:tRNA A37 methylthiotransferase MiaB